jgi:DNA-binding MarR family transcriptional regulator
MTGTRHVGMPSKSASRGAFGQKARPDSIATVLAQWSRQRRGLDLRPLGMFVTLAHAYWLTAPRIESLMADHGINRGIFDVLTTLRRVGEPYTLAPRQIARSLLLSGAGLTSRLQRLEMDKLIVRLPDPHDGRGLKARLTPKGLRLVDRILPKLIRLEADLAARLSDKQMAELTDLLDLLADSAQPARKKARRRRTGTRTRSTMRRPPGASK